MRAFTDQRFSGNPAAVVLDGDALSAQQMQQLAPELNNVSETVFVCAASDPGADLRLRYFTTTMEVDLCGHATIAAIYALAESDRLKDYTSNGIIRAETLSGVIELGLELDAGLLLAVSMDQPPAQHAVPTHPERAASILGIPEDALCNSVPVACCHTGIWSCYVPLVDLPALAAIQVERDQIENIWPENKNLAGVYPFVITDASAAPTSLRTQGRFFCPPRFGIAEDPVTGTATGALGAHLMQRGLLACSGELRAQQGIEMGCAGTMSVRRKNDGRMQISGQAVPVYRGQLML